MFEERWARVGRRLREACPAGTSICTSPIGAIGVGATVAIICYIAVAFLKPRFGYDDSLDVVGIHGVGGIAGPLAAGWAMSLLGTPGLFLTTLSAHVPLVLFALWRISKRAAVAQDKKAEFVPAPLARV